MSRRAARPVTDRRTTRSRWETYALVVVVLIVSATVALACMGTRGFTATTSVPDRCAPRPTQPCPK